MKIEKMKKPGDTLNVPCDWCDKSSHFTVQKGATGIYFYACEDHEDQLARVHESLNKYKHLGSIQN